MSNSVKNVGHDKFSGRTGKLKDLPIEFVDGDRSSRYPSGSDIQESGIPFLSTKNIENNSLKLTDLKYISEEKFEELRKGHVRPDDILMTTRGSVGNVALFNTEKYDRGFINAQMLIIRTVDDSIDQRFLYYLLCSEIFQSKLEKFSSGSAQPQIPIKDLENIKISYPRLAKQRKIASILSAFDELIENNKRRIEILEEMAETIYREWFVNFNFPGSEGLAMKDSELGIVPERFEVVKLKKISNVNRENLNRDTAPEKINYITLSDVENGKILDSELLKWEESPGRAKRVVKHGDIIWGSVRPAQQSFALVIDPKPHTIVSTGFAVISADKVPFTYLYKYLTTDRFVEYLVNVATGANYPAANVSDYKEAKVLKPPDYILKRFHERLLPIFEMKNELNSVNEVLRELRDLLIPKLISGEIKV